MGGIRKKKGASGQAKMYINRNRACKMLQLGLPEFRRLCILKGVYPREPRSRKKAQRGDTSIKVLYLRKDIVYLSHEPLIWKIREAKIHRRELTTLRTKKYKKEAKFKQALQRPVYKYDHIVLERYPSFDKALRDLDDALSAMFLYASLPNEQGIDSTAVHLCKKLTTEFLNYVVESRSLIKTFISIRGYFYRAHIMGEVVTWMVPHPFKIMVPIEVEMRIMRTFIDFYCTFLGFINFKLYHSLNLYYPPKPAVNVKSDENTSRQETMFNVLESLNSKLQTNNVDEEAEDEYDNELLKEKFQKKLKMVFEEKMKIQKQKTLFENVKFYLGRETNRDSLTLVIRSAGGLVSWDEILGPGFSYREGDSTIKYQICDRPSLEQKHLSRYYLQPQWVYDSFNAGMLLPVQNYFPGVELPAHLSPFEEVHHKLYNPPEMERLKALQNKIKIVGDKTIEELKLDIELEEEEEEEEDEYNEEVMDEPNEINEMTTASGMSVRDIEVEAVDPLLAKMKVKHGKAQKINEAHNKRLKENEDFKLASTFIHRKQKRFFKKILAREKKVKQYSHALRKRRIIYEEEMQKRRKMELKKKAAAAASSGKNEKKVE